MYIFLICIHSLFIYKLIYKYQIYNIGANKITYFICFLGRSYKFILLFKYIIEYLLTKNKYIYICLHTRSICSVHCTPRHSLCNTKVIYKRNEFKM